MPARLVLNLRSFEQFADAQGWKTKADEAAALGISEVQLYRVRQQKTAPGEKFIGALLATALPTGKWDFHDLFIVLGDKDVVIPLPAPAVQDVA